MTESQINSLRELISQHEVVRIKLTSDKMNAMEISKVFSDDEKVSQTCELLEVRIKGFMFGRKSLRQSEARKKKV